MKKIIVLIFVLLLAGCTSSVLPNKEKELSDFVLQDGKIVEQKMYSTNEDFAKEHFPADCEWEELVSVVDGDTIEVDDGMHVRFIGIDTPETKDPDKPVQRFGMEASRRTKELLGDDEKVCLIADSEGDEYDIYHRKLAYIFTEDGVDVNRELLKGGFARGYLYFSFSRKEEFRALHEEAKKAGVGMWEKQ